MSKIESKCKTCASCKHFGYEGPKHDNPWPEFWCNKDKWDGIKNTDELYEPIECEAWESKKI